MNVCRCGVLGGTEYTSGSDPNCSKVNDLSAMMRVPFLAVLLDTLLEVQRTLLPLTPVAASMRLISQERAVQVTKDVDQRA